MTEPPPVTEPPREESAWGDALRALAELDAPAWARALAVLAAAAAAAWMLHAVLFLLLRRWARRPETPIEDRSVGRLSAPARWLLVLGGLHLALPIAPLDVEVHALLQHTLGIALILATAFALLRLVERLEHLVERRHRIDVADNLRARSLRTQTRVIGRLLGGAILFIAVAAILMTFPRVRQVGTSLLASAGLAGIVVGLAARPMLSNVIAGLQIAFAEPIRLDDVVIVQGEWGRVEELNATHVVVKVWDERRLVVPLSWFLENPFENWTKTSAELVGTVFLYLDYEVPLAPLRAELQRVCEGSELWDGRVCKVQVTDCRADRLLEVRALVSAGDSGRLWDLRCLVREALVEHLRSEHPEALPRLRATLEHTPPPGGPDPSAGGRPEPGPPS